jgi:hypothetical protein
MPSRSSIVAAIALGAIGGALFALWVTLAEAQGLSAGETPHGRATHVDPGPSSR